MENAALLFLWMSTQFPGPAPAPPAFLRHLCDFKLALGWPQSGQAPAGSALGAAHRTFGLAQSRESLGALRLRIHWVEWGVFVGYSLQSWPGKWAPEQGSWARICQVPQESRGANKRYAFGLRQPGRCARAGREQGGCLEGQGGSVPVFSLINDVHAAARGSCALSLALGLVENRQGNVWNRAHQAHLAGAGAPTRPTLAAPWGWEARATAGTQPRPSPGCGGSGGWSLQPEQLRSHRAHAQRCLQPGRDRTRQRLQRGAGHRPPRQCQPRGRAESGGGADDEGGEVGDAEPRDWLKLAGWLRVGLTVTALGTGASSQPETEREQRERERGFAGSLPCRRPSLSEGRGWSTERERERERCGLRRRQEGPCIASGTEQQGGTDRPTHGLTARVAAAELSAGKPESRAGLSGWARDRQTTCRETDGQTGGGGTFIPSSPPGQRRQRRAPWVCLEQWRAAGAAGSPAEATGVAEPVASTALQGSQPTL